ncbi:MAG TPA: AarF/UbiB family protein, partial [Longimicrobiales bacterium]
RVVLKVMKPGMRDLVERDLVLLQLFGGLLQLLLPRYQPRQIIGEFATYTRREVDFTFEADNIEMFTANFRDMPGVVFPHPYRALSTADVLTMDYLEGYRPGAVATSELPQDERERLIDLGAAAIIRMLYQDGFFHADLHAGNLLILPGEPCRIGFIDLGMVGRFEERTRRRMLYYYHALVTGDVGGAAKFLTEMATPGRGADLDGFRRAVADLSRRFYTRASRGEFSIAQLILESVGLGAQYRITFPVEMTLMVKALVTFEGVGRILDPHLDITALSRRHITRVFRGHMNPTSLTRELLRGAPELLDVAVDLPRLITSGVRLLEEASSQRAPRDPFPGIRSAVLAAACLIGGVLSVVTHGPIVLSVILFVLATLLTIFSR